MNGTLYQGSKPVMWSPVEKTALAEAEVEYHDRQTDAIWVRFPVAEVKTNILEVMAGHPSGVGEFAGEVVQLLKSASVLIWTTTPWTIPQNRAICFGPRISYGVYEVTERPEECWATIGERLIVADALAEQIFEQARLGESGMGTAAFVMLPLKS